MNRFLKTPILYSVFLFLSLFSSCGVSEKKFRVGVSQCSSDEWREQLNREILREAMFYGDVEVEFRSANDDNSRQIADMQSFMDRRFDLIIVAPNEAVPITPIVEKVYDSGIPVVVVDRKIASDKYSAYIGADNFEIGKSVGRYVVNRLKGRGTIIELAGLKGSSAAIDRHQGFMTILSQTPNIQVIASVDALWKELPAMQLTDSLMKRYSQVDAIYAHNDRMAYGAYKAAQNLKREQETWFVGVDALSGKGRGIDLVSKGFLDASFIYPTAGDRVMQTAYKILNRQSYNRDTRLTTAMIDSGNARIAQLQVNQIAELDNRIQTLNVRIINHQERNALQQYFLFATLGIVVLVGVILLLVAKTLRVKNRLNRELRDRNEEITTQKEQLEVQRDQLIELSTQLEEATHAKLVFFTNISHDFRTPLTLIADPVDHLLEDEHTTPEQRSLLGVVRKNIDVLLRLVSEILDFRRYENGKADLMLSQIDLLACITEWNNAFRSGMDRRGIRFLFSADRSADYRTLLDVGKIERVYFNLLSNALKFTPREGRIVVELLTRDNASVSMVGFRITNSSKGISAEHIRNIFDRFYRVDAHSEGSGIGLALSKAYVDLHGGEITVESVEHGETSFAVWLPCRNDSEQPLVEAVVSFSSEPCCAETFMDDQLLSDTLCDEVSGNRPQVLIIDDNDDIRQYIAMLLRSEYQLLEASDGYEGLKLAVRYIPDVIISDIMMPGMDGVELCGRLKTELTTCHIPILMLTACALDEQRIAGFAQGADAYISKPFNSKLLLVRLRNLIENRRRLKPSNPQAMPLRENVTDEEQVFIQRFNSLLDQRLADSELNVEDLGREMGFSRVQLYRKVKAMTGQTPNELLRIARLKRGTFLLRTTKKSVSEVAYEVGFTAPSYFSKCYKEYFGEAPTELANRIGGKG